MWLGSSDPTWIAPPIANPRPSCSGGVVATERQDHLTVVGERWQVARCHWGYINGGHQGRPGPWCENGRDWNAGTIKYRNTNHHIYSAKFQIHRLFLAKVDDKDT